MDATEEAWPQEHVPRGVGLVALEEDGMRTLIQELVTMLAWGTWLAEEV